MYDLTPFCGTESFAQYTITSPWQHDDWQYATDRVICVRVPMDPVSSPRDEEDRPKAFTLFEEFPECLQLWPEHDGTKQEYPCTSCKGSKTVNCECPNCENVHDAPCGECVDGRELRPKSLTIAGHIIAGKYCLKIQRLGTVLFCPDGEAEELLAFKCGELQGLVSPWKPERER